MKRFVTSRLLWPKRSSSERLDLKRILVILRTNSCACVWILSCLTSQSGDMKDLRGIGVSHVFLRTYEIRLLRLFGCFPPPGFHLYSKAKVEFRSGQPLFAAINNENFAQRIRLCFEFCLTLLKLGHRVTTSLLCLVLLISGWRDSEVDCRVGAIQLKISSFVLKNKVYLRIMELQCI